MKYGSIMHCHNNFTRDHYKISDGHKPPSALLPLTGMWQHRTPRFALPEHYQHLSQKAQEEESLPDM